MILLNLLGGVALLVWGTHVVQAGFTAAYGAELRRLVGKAMSHRLAALLVGLGVAGVLQSSTATALITVSFARQGLVQTAPGLAVMLGADVGTTLVVQALALDLSWLSPLLILAGVISVMLGRAAVRQNVGRAVIGLGLMLLALRQIGRISEPLRESPALAVVLEALSGEPLMLVLLAALLAWLAHSSLALVLLVVSLGSAEVLPLQSAFALVLGANLGGVLPPVTATLRSDAQSRRIPLGNLAFKTIGVAVALPLLGPAGGWLARLPGGAGRRIANFHTGFNLALALAFIFLTGPAARLLSRLVPDQVGAEDPSRPKYLDPAAVENPPVALAYATRETLRMGDIVESMLARTVEVLAKDDPALAEEIETMDDQVDRLYEGIKHYLTEVSRGQMNERDSRRATEILSFTINLEHIGDIIDINLMELAGKKIAQKLKFSREGFREIQKLHTRLLKNLRLAFGLFVTGERETARLLIKEKTRFRNLERAAAESHLARLRGRKSESIETSAIHLDILNEFKRINSHLTTVAYPIANQEWEAAPPEPGD